MSRTSPPHGIAAAAEQEIHAMPDCVDLLVHTARRRRRPLVDWGKRSSIGLGGTVNREGVR